VFFLFAVDLYSSGAAAYCRLDYLLTLFGTCSSRSSGNRGFRTRHGPGRWALLSRSSPSRVSKDRQWCRKQPCGASSDLQTSL